MICFVFSRGKDDPVRQEAAFRKEYGRLGELRILVDKSVPLVSLTATASPHTRTVICQELGMLSPSFVCQPANKQNIRYSVITRGESIYSSFKWLIDELETYGQECQRYIIFCHNSSHMAEMFREFRVILGP